MLKIDPQPEPDADLSLSRRRRLRLLAIPLALLIGLVGPLVLASWYTLELQRESLENALNSEIDQIANVLANGLSEPIWNLIPELGKPLVDSVMQDGRVTSVTVTSGAQGSFLQSRRDGPPPAHAKVLRREITHQNHKIGSVVLEIDTSHVFSAMQSEWRRIYMVGAIQIILSLIVVFFVARLMGRLQSARALGAANKKLRAEIEDRIQAEDDSRKNEALVQALVEHSPVALSIKDMDGRYTFISPAYTKYLETNAEDAVGKKAANLVSQETLAILKQADKVVIDSGAALRHDEAFTVKFNDATLLVTKFPIKENDGRIIGVGTVGIDITEQERAEAALHENEAYLRALVDASPSAIFLKDRAGRYVVINDAYEKLVCNKRENILGKTIAELDLLSDEYVKEIEELDKMVLDSGQVIHREHHPILPDGRTPVTLLTKFPIFDADGEATGVGAIETEITELKRAEEALHESEVRFRNIVEHSPTAVSLKDSDGQYQLVNRQFEDWYGVTASETIGKTSREVFPPDVADTMADLDRKVMDSRRVEVQEVELPFSDGKIHTTVVTNFPVADSRGEISGIGSINWDVTSQRAAEEQLRQAQKMEAVGQLTGGVAHDFNNLLTIILGNLDLLADINAGDPDAQRLIEIATRSSQRGAELTQRLLAFSRKQALNPQNTDVNALVVGLTKIMERTLTEAIEIRNDLADDLWPAVVDQGQLENAILNLAINARDAMGESGVLAIETANSTLGQAYCKEQGDLLPGRYVMVTISDTGPGILDEVLDHVFEPFYTTKGVGKGSGLGLSMVYGFCKQSGGHVTIESPEGQGAVVRLYLPAPRSAEKPVGPVAKTADIRGGDETLLVVEDDPDVRAFLTTALRGLGYGVLEAEDGTTALAALASAGHIDLLVSDVLLPGGMNGRDIAVEVRRARPETKVLFTSGNAETAIVHDGCLDEGVELLSKPYTKRALAARVRQVLDTGEA